MRLPGSTSAERTGYLHDVGGSVNFFLKSTVLVVDACPAHLMHPNDPRPQGGGFIEDRDDDGDRGRHGHQSRRTSRQSLWPPNPKEFEIAARR